MKILKAILYKINNLKLSKFLWFILLWIVGFFTSFVLASIVKIIFWIIKISIS
jgi:hypothetical protein